MIASLCILPPGVTFASVWFSKGVDRRAQQQEEYNEEKEEEEEGGGGGEKRGSHDGRGEAAQCRGGEFAMSMIDKWCNIEALMFEACVRCVTRKPA